MGQKRISTLGEEPKKKEKQKQTEKKKESVKGVGLKGGERIKTVEAGPIKEEVSSETKTGKEKKAVGKPKQRSQKYRDAKAKVDPTKLYSLKEAVKLVKETSYSQFNGTVELHLVVKKEGISVNLVLPHSAGKEKKIEIADDQTIEKLEKGKIDFEVLLATPEMMLKLVPFARLLGPKGLMPNPKNGTLIKSKEEAKKFSASSMTIKTERKAPLIHTVVGKVNQTEKELTENIEAVFKAIGPRQILKAFLKATMGPGIKIGLN